MKSILSIIFLLFFVNSFCQNIRNKVFFGIPTDVNEIYFCPRDKVIINLPKNNDGRFLFKNNSRLDNLLVFLKNIKDQQMQVELKINYCHSNISSYNLKIAESLKKSLEIFFSNNNATYSTIIAKGCTNSLFQFSDEEYGKMGGNNIEITIF